MENKKFFAEEQGFCVQKKFLAYLSAVFLVFFLLKKLDLFQFSQGTGDALFVFFPIALVLGVIGWNFWQTQNSVKENLRKNIFQKTLFLNLNLVLFCLAFYFLYSPESFFPFFVAVIFFVRRFFTLESFFFFFSSLALLVVSFSLSLVFLQLYQKNKKADSFLGEKFSKNILYGNFFFLIFIFVLSFASFPSAYQFLTEPLAKLFFDFSGEKTVVLGASSDWKRFQKVRDFSHSLADNLFETKEIIKKDFQATTENLALDFNQKQIKINQDLIQVSGSLKEKIEEDVSEKLSVSGGTIEGELIVQEKLELEDLAVALSIQPKKDGTYDLGSRENGWNKIYVSHLVGSSPITIGQSLSEFDLNDDDDLIISGDLEVQRNSYLNNLNISGQLSLDGQSLVNNLNADYLDGHSVEYFQTALTDPVTGSGSQNQLARFVGENLIGSSVIYDNGLNVGIGTANPTKNLEVVGSIKASYRIYLGNGYWSSNGNDIFLNAGSTGQGIYLRPNGDASSVGAMNIAASGVHRFFNSSGTEQVRFNNGNVGIGISDVRQKLHIKQNGTLTGNTADGVSVGLLIDAKSNVLSNPSLSLVGTNSNSYNTEARIELIGDEYTNYSSALSFKFRTGGTILSERMRISANGNIGIGTTNPQKPLHISNISALPQFRIQSSGAGGRSFDLYSTPNTSSLGGGKFIIYDATANESRLTINSLGNIGIGTVSPTEKLEINGGNIKVTGGSFIDDGTTLSVPDYVFEDGYNLRSIPDLEAYLAVNFHLPGVPSRDEIKRNGMNYGTMLMNLLEKTEENTLYTIDNYKELERQKTLLGFSLENNNVSVEEQLTILGGRMEKLENWIPVFTGMTEEWIPAFARMTSDINTIETNLSQLTLNIQQLTADHANLELKVLELELALAGIETGFELPEEFQALKQALENAQIAFDADGNLKVKKIEAEEVEAEGLRVKQDNLIIESSGGNCFRVKVQADGVLQSEAVDCASE